MKSPQAFRTISSFSEIIYRHMTDLGNKFPNINPLKNQVIDL